MGRGVPFSPPLPPQLVGWGKGPAPACGKACSGALLPTRARSWGDHLAVAPSWKVGWLKGELGGETTPTEGSSSPCTGHSPARGPEPGERGCFQPTPSSARPLSEGTWLGDHPSTWLWVQGAGGQRGKKHPAGDFLSFLAPGRLQLRVWWGVPPFPPPS